MNKKKITNLGIVNGSSRQEILNREKLFSLFKSTPIPNEELLSNLGLFISRQNLSRILLVNELYKKIINLHGIIMEFGVRWGQNLALFESLRGMYEPYNYSRKIVGFDTFTGFSSVSEQDGQLLSKGDYSTALGYKKYLEELLSYHESESPIKHKKKFEIIKGDVVETIDQYLSDNPATMIALAVFDLDLYIPTKKCLESIKSRLGKGSILLFDELNCSDFPGETLAFDEVFGINNYEFRRDPNNPSGSYITV